MQGFVNNGIEHRTKICVNTHYYKCCNSCCPIETSIPSGIIPLNGVQVQLQGGAGALLGNRCGVLFDSEINKPGSGISYNSQTGIFILPANKSFYAAWWVAVDGTEFSSNVEFAILLNNKIAAISSSPLVTCQLSGTALIPGGSDPGALSLINVSGSTVRYAASTAQANMVIIELYS